MTNKAEWVLVPREPDDDMLNAAQNQVEDIYRVEAAKMYRAMLAAAPTPPEQDPREATLDRMAENAQELGLYDAPPEQEAQPVAKPVAKRPLWDSQWGDIVNDPKVRTLDREDAILRAIKLTEEAVHGNTARRIEALEAELKDCQQCLAETSEAVAVEHFALEKVEAERDRLREALEEAAQIVMREAFPSERARFGVAADAIRALKAQL